MNDLVPVAKHLVRPDLFDKARDYAARSKSAATIRAYRSALRSFITWCKAQGVMEPFPSPPALVAAYLADKAASLKVSTLQRHLVAINEAHVAAGLERPSSAPEVRATMKGIRRTHGTAPKKKAPLSVSHLRRIVHRLPRSIIGVRDHALLLVCYAGALRRSELVNLSVGDLDFREDGLAITVRKSKTDQESEGRVVGIPFGSNPMTCPVRAMRRWLEVSEITSGPVFRPVNRHGQVRQSRLSGKAVGVIVQRSVELIGMDPAGFGGHSLRAGLATDAANAGVSERAIMQQTGHRSVATVRGYIRNGSLFLNNAAAAVGL